MSLFFTKVVRTLFVFFVLPTVLLSGCVSQKRIKYIQDPQKTTANLTTEVRIPTKIQPNDELYIRVNSFDEKAFQFFNGSTGNTQMNNTVAVNLVSYTVDEKGNIDFPFIGELKMGGLTLAEAKVTIEKSLKSFLEEVSVSVKFVSNTVTILGEVNHPGQLSFIKGQLTVFQAVGLAGDITDFGNRKEVVLVREEENTTKFFYLDLTDINVVQSPNYYLKPNDVLIVHPLKQKQWGFKTFPYTILFSAISTTLVLLNFLNK